MSRKVFDILASVGGIAIVVALVVAGGLLTWGHSFVNSNVHNQLSQQQIYFPPKAAFAHPKAGTAITPSMIPSVSQFAGQQLLTGEQAKVYANDFIAVHLSEMPYGGVYSKVSAAALANPKNTQLAQVKQTVFTGTTLRGLLLEAYAFSTVGVIMLWGAIVSFILAAVVCGARWPRLLARAPDRRRGADPGLEAKGGSGFLLTVLEATWQGHDSSPRRPRRLAGVGVGRCGSPDYGDRRLFLLVQAELVPDLLEARALDPFLNPVALVDPVVTVGLLHDLTR